METISEIEDVLAECSDFEEFGSLEKARRFITYANRWLILTPEETQDQFTRLRLNTARVEHLLDRARAYVSTNSSANARNGGRSSVRFLGLGGFR